jgi:hypothetical protein
VTDRYTKTILTIIAVALVALVLRVQSMSQASAQTGKVRSTVCGLTSLIRADQIWARMELLISRTPIGKKSRMKVGNLKWRDKTEHMCSSGVSDSCAVSRGAVAPVESPDVRSAGASLVAYRSMPS